MHKAIAAILLLGGAAVAQASDHLDTPTVKVDPRADIGDLYAWIDPDRRHLDLVMTIVGKSFSPRIDYVFHVDSGPRFGATPASVTITCRFSGATVECSAGTGRVSGPLGQSIGDQSFRLFAGLRDDPFFNNVRGTRDAYDAAQAALARGARMDDAGCPQFDRATSADILARWKRTDGGPGTNFLEGWTSSAIILSVDLALAARGGPILAVWGATAGPQGQIDRAARPLTGNALLATLGSEVESNALKEVYNRATPATAAAFVPELAKGAALYDGFDGVCGNGLLVRPKTPPAERYRAIAALLADDRLWLDARARRCTRLFAVERGLASDCGGRAPSYDAVNAYRSLLVDDTATSVDDGVHRDELPVSDSRFPFLNPPVEEARR